MTAWSPRAAACAAGLVLVSMGAASCSVFNGEVTDDVPVSFSFPSTSATPSTPPTTTTTLPDLTQVDLGSVRGETTSVLPIATGNVVLGGQVVGPDGPVDGAVVRIERFIGERGTTAEVTTDGRGYFSVRGFSGGRYRVRAWRSPDYLMTAATVFFVDASKATGEIVFADGTAIPANKLSLQVQSRGGLTVSSAASRRVFGIGEVVVLSVRVGAKQVDAKGSVTIGPLAGAVVTLTGTGPWSFYSATQATTDGDGVVAFEASCGSYGRGSIEIDVNGVGLSVPTPSCGYPPTTTSVATITTSSFDPNASTFSSFSEIPVPGTAATQTLSVVP